MSTRLTLEEIAEVKKNISSDAYQKKLRENFPSLTVHSHIGPTVHSIAANVSTVSGSSAAATEAPSTSAAAEGGGVRPFNPYGSYPAMPTVSLPPLSTRFRGNPAPHPKCQRQLQWPLGALHLLHPGRLFQ